MRLRYRRPFSLTSKGGSGTKKDLPMGKQVKEYLLREINVSLGKR